MKDWRDTIEVRWIDHETWDEKLGVVPPVAWIDCGFLLGEPVTHRVCRVTNQTAAAWSPFCTVRGRPGHWAIRESLTQREWMALDHQHLMAAAARCVWRMTPGQQDEAIEAAMQTWRNALDPDSLQPTIIGAAAKLATMEAMSVEERREHFMLAWAEVPA